MGPAFRNVPLSRSLVRTILEVGPWPNKPDFRRYVLRGVLIAVALLILFFVVLALFVLSLPEGWNT